MRYRAVACFSYVSCAIGVFIAGNIHGEIFRCLAQDGIVKYTDLPCPDGERINHLPAQPTHPPREPAGLTSAEQKALASLDKRLARRAKKRLAALADARRSTFRQLAKREQACRVAERQLNAIKAERRSGYALAKGRALKRKEDRYKAIKAEAC